jgi:excisionase family DNA binding protein
MENILTTEQVAEYLGLRKSVIHRYVRQGKLDCVQLSFKERRFTESHLKEFIQRQTISKVKPIDRPRPERLSSRPRKKEGGEKSTGDSARAIRKEMRSWQL